jgi:hypothetical protein
MIYGDGNSCLLMVAREHTCIFHWSVSLDRWPKNVSNHPCSFNTNKYTKITKTWKQWMTPRISTMWFVLGGCHSGGASEEGILGLSEWHRFHVNVLSCIGKERKMGVLQTILLCVQIFMQSGLREWQVHSYTRGSHPLCFVTTCNNGVFNGGVFMHFSIFFLALIVDIKLLWRIF